MVNLPFAGHTNPTLGLAKDLVGQGCEVDYINAPDWQERIETTGAHFIPYDRVRHDQSPIGPLREISSWSAAYQTARRMAPAYDCLIYEMLFLPGAALAAEAGIPSYRLFSTFVLNPMILKELGETGGPYMTSVFKHPALCRSVGRRIKRRFHLSHDDIGAELWLNQPRRNYVYTVRPMQPHQEMFPEQNYRFVGSAASPERNGGSRDDRGRAGKADGENSGGTRSGRALSRKKRPLIYVSLGTQLGVRAGLLRQLMGALADLAVSVMVSTQGIPPARLGPIPSNVETRPAWPQIRVLEQADLFITHGGMNSVNEVLACGVPMVVIPAGNDQPMVARQVSGLGCGEVLDRRNLSAAEVRKTVRTILADPQYRQAAGRLSVLESRAGGNRRIAEEILSDLD